MRDSSKHPSGHTVGQYWAAAPAATILLGAFLLFQVQPLVSKAILPWFGGCPAVWTTCMLFFQTLLFGGYLYAHLLQERFAPRGQAIIHLALVAAAALLPIVPGASWKPAVVAHPTAQILLLLACSVGLPYFTLSATSPLVQAWYGRLYPGRSPYRLYALSNFGSLAALLSYPFVFEPAFTLASQTMLWSAAFACYGILCVVMLLQLRRLRAEPSSASCELPEASTSASPSVRDRVGWFLLPACASALLLAATNHVCQDVAVIPLLWVVPLALYLLSFILCFDHARWYIRPFWASAALATLFLAVANDYTKTFSSHFGLKQELALYFTALFCACMVCHGELARQKPPARRLTEFYLWIAAGGAAGGILVGIVAPLVFLNYWEWPIAAAVSALLAVRLLVLTDDVRRQWGRHTVMTYAAAVILMGTALWACDFIQTTEQKRNFFGVVAVEERMAGDPKEHQFVLRNGRIMHGQQFVAPSRRRRPTLYYGEASGVGRAIRWLQKSGPLRVGAIGLGTGTLAAYARSGDEFRFYEINPEVLQLAQRYFYYLADCRGHWDVAMGDARLSLEAESATQSPPPQFRLLVLDAFSGDAIPTHLLTREAFDVYNRRLTPDGVIAVHISNHYLRLAPVVHRLAEHLGMRAVRVCVEKKDTERLTEVCQWMLVTRNKDFLRENPSQPADAGDDPGVPLWTDQYNNLFQILTVGQ